MLEHLLKKFGAEGSERFTRDGSPLEMSASKVGIRFAPRRMVRSIHAHRLTEWCNQQYPSKSDDLVHNIFYQYFEVGVDIGIVDNLVEIAVMSGLNRFEAQRVLNSKTYLDEVTEKDGFAKLRLRVSGVPSFTINYQTKRKPFTFSGAQPPEVMIQFLEEACKST